MNRILKKVLFLVVFLQVQSVVAETVSQMEAQDVAGTPKLNKNWRIEKYPPRTAKFVKSKRTADSYANADWMKLTETQKAAYIYKLYSQITKAHGLTQYSSSILTCKANKESEFRPQVRTSGANSTAAGIGQVTKTTAKDLFKRGGWFRSKVQGFEKIADGTTFYNTMPQSMTAQMELGLAVLHQKSMDTGSRKISTILRNYYGNKSASKNRSYANAIINCSNCIVKSGITKKCLDKAKR